jgi:diacylglycerol kinase family enzyme
VPPRESCAPAARGASTSAAFLTLRTTAREAMRYFVGVSSCGMSTKVIERVKAGGPDWLPANTPKWLGGRISFGASLLQTALRTEATRLLVQLDDEHERQLVVVNLSIANARYFGGGMKIAPEAN